MKQCCFSGILLTRRAFLPKFPIRNFGIFLGYSCSTWITPEKDVQGSPLYRTSISWSKFHISRGRGSSLRFAPADKLFNPGHFIRIPGHFINIPRSFYQIEGYFVRGWGGWAWEGSLSPPPDGGIRSTKKKRKKGGKREFPKVIARRSSAEFS